MPMAALISLSRLTEVFRKLGFLPRSDGSNIFERSEDHLMFFPDVRDGQVTLIDVFRQIQRWQVDEPLAEKFLETLSELGEACLSSPPA